LITSTRGRCVNPSASTPVDALGRSASSRGNGMPDRPHCSQRSCDETSSRPVP
jgi:hypothetical protein